jgi:hypothetical protein
MDEINTVTISKLRDEGEGAKLLVDKDKEKDTPIPTLVQMGPNSNGFTLFVSSSANGSKL